MKRVFLSLSLMLTVAVATTFANDETNVNELVRQSFKREFAGAEFVTWSEQGDYLKALFILAGHRAEAFFSTSGEFVGSLRDLFYDQLPLAVIKSVDSKFTDASIMDVKEVSSPEETTYRITLESGSKKYRLKVNSGGNITETEKIKK